MKHKGWGPWADDWYSFCSAHRQPRVGCSCCQAGEWVNCWRHKIDHLIYRCCPRLWRWWHNRPNSSTRRELERWFPNLRTGNRR